ncbi:MAG: biotin transporter BioY [Actinomycetales bacterium]|nr:biotin transporter BioY [Actinomycetales bacterium]
MKFKVTLRDIARIAIFAAVLALLGLPGAINLPGGVPITAQTLGVMLAGAILGSWRGAASVLLFEVLVALGFPLLSGGHGGLAVFAGPTAGYLYGWIVGAWVIGAIVNAAKAKPGVLRLVLGLVLGGIVVVYALGIPVLAASYGMSLGAAAASNLIFLIGDSIKVAVSAILVLALYRAYPKAFAN